MRNHRSMKPSTGMVSPSVPMIATCLFALFVLVLLMEARSWSTNQTGRSTDRYPPSTAPSIRNGYRQ
jgi:hypothetical protein